jgi:RES domain-containing protein
LRLWRLTREPFQDLDGEGARQFGGRWNGAGVAVVYTSSTLALAVLELLVHVDPEEMPTDLVALCIEGPDSASQRGVSLEALPSDWNRILDHPACRTVGEDWVREGGHALLRVPSAIVPEEENVLLNPAHPEAAGFVVTARRAFALDPRLLR